MPTESEIKLRLAPGYLSKVSEHPLVSRDVHQGPMRKHLQSIYFDTPDLGLLKQGVGLRVRRIDHRWVQTVKGASSGGAGLHRRQEWESEVDNNSPNLERLAAEAKVGVLGEADLAARLIPVFETDFWRTSWILQIRDESAIELALDEGHICSNSRTEPLSELELELKQGEDRDLYWMALQLAEIVPLTVEHASKAERGYRLYTQQFSPLAAPEPAPADAVTDFRLLGYWLADLQYGERLLLERRDPQGCGHLQAAAENLHRSLVAAGQGVEVHLQEDLDWLVRGLQESKDFAEACHLVAAPRYSRLLLRLGGYLAELEARG
ncbi:inorganic triphosphatase [Nitrosococcus wardiae]|uniref:CYTH domain-containing protein n=1 Tax=Nitrosococcus wardiae TaxID=1814290 RepID=A0A4P7BZ92_9GAMM|nr:CYTH domain-containing protein [Nitrosococcus wardiae]QBQ54589.1 CYTH domain-containing protein [Nitrosococcus wardiae]